MAGINPIVRVPVKVSQVSGNYLVSATVIVQPQGKTERMAAAGECQVGLYHVFTDREDKLFTESYTLAPNAYGVNATLSWPMASMELPTGTNTNEYKIRVTHVASGAAVEKHWRMNAEGVLTQEFAQVVKAEGSEMPATFSQRRPLSRGYRRG